MQITSPALPNVSYPQSRASSQGSTKGAGVTACEVQSRCSNNSAQRPEHKPLSEYRVGQLARGVLQAETGLVRSTAGFVFSQVMNSHDIGAVAPGLKESLLVLAALYNELQPTQAQCRDDQFTCNDGQCIDSFRQCDGVSHCYDQSDELGCTQDKCDELKRDFLCNTSLSVFNSPEYLYKCLPPDDLCNGIYDCHNPPDEGPGFCDQFKCDELKREFRCSDGQCIDSVLGCDGNDGDCTDGSDEGPEHCTKMRCEQLGRFLCNEIGNYPKCISPDKVCDGFYECYNPMEEGMGFCNQEKCDELKRGFKCNWYAPADNYPRIHICISPDRECDGVPDCDDPADEGPGVCN